MGVMKNNFIICFLILLFSRQIIKTEEINKEYFDKIKNSVELKQDEQLVVIYFCLTYCGKCYMQPLEKIDTMVKDSILTNFKILALVTCNRDKELKIFQKHYQWKDYMYRDDGKARKNLCSNNEVYMTVFDYEGNKLKEFE